MAKRRLVVNQEEIPHQKPTQLEPWSWTSGLQNWETIHFFFEAIAIYKFALAICLYKDEIISLTAADLQHSL